MRRAGRKDCTQAAVVTALRQIGVVVHVVNSEGSPDLLTWSQKTGWLPIEVKRPSGKLTRQQAALRELAPFPVVYGVSEALKLFGVTEGVQRCAR